MISIVIPGRVTKSRPRRGKFGGMYTPKDTETTENLIKWIFCNEYKGFIPLERPLKMRITATFIKAKGNKMSEPMLKPDADNTAKVCCDALNKLAYLDDKQIVDLRILKEWGITEQITITIEESYPF